MKFKSKKSISSIHTPSLSEDALKELAGKIRPLIKFIQYEERGLVPSPQGFLCFVEQSNIRKKTYLDNPRAQGRAVGIEKLCEIKTYHRFSNDLYFSPSIEEVLACIPDECREDAVAFFIHDRLYEGAEYEEAHGAGYHIALTRLYKKR